MAHCERSYRTQCTVEKGTRHTAGQKQLLCGREGKDTATTILMGQCYNSGHALPIYRWPRPSWPLGGSYESHWTSTLETWTAVKQGERPFPCKLELTVAIGECELQNGFSWYCNWLWQPCYKPLTSKVIQKIHNSFLGGHPGGDATIDLVS